jgi:hypothetical protein
VDISGNTTIGGDLAVTGTSPGVSSIEMFYRADAGLIDVANVLSGYYSATPPISSDGSYEHVYITGIAPTGFSSVSSMYLWWIKTQDTSGGLNLQASWQCSADGEAFTTHSQAGVELTEADTGENFSSNIMYRSEIGQDITLDTTLAAGDAFGFRITNTGPDDCKAYGISIVWAF